ncbi:MAG TPA: lysophospholipid acyltransferase family protein [Casimicrobiaceae bacterium]|nr:lysophospholipid acyltransferase family protein [Casimicrobiaceae bacterium]
MRLLLRSLARWPLWALYGLGAVIYFIAFRILRWHVALASRNLANAFPEKSDAERAAILKESYWNLGQTLGEAFWGFRAPSEELRRRVVIENREPVLRYAAEKRSVILLTAHMCNWEWLLQAGGAELGFPIDVVYKPIRLASVDEFFREARSRFGGKPITIDRFVYELMRRASEARAYALVADQTPVRKADKHWTRFLNQDTAFYVGADKIARFLDAPVVYVAMRRVRRGYYAARIHVLAEPPYDADLEPPLIERYARRLEDEIRAHPADWLWVHNKWKYAKGADE